MTDTSHFSREVLSYREQLAPAMEITDEADADNYMAEYVRWLRRRGIDGDIEPGSGDCLKTLLVAKQNLGYFAGYYSHETRDRVERLFRCDHPILGSIAKNGPPTPQQAFDAGVNYAKENK